jgi:hypothetical protein
MVSGDDSTIAAPAPRSAPTMETTMMRFKSSELPLLIPLTLLLGAAITQADANRAHYKNTATSQTIRSIVNPAPNMLAEITFQA